MDEFTNSIAKSQLAIARCPVCTDSHRSPFVAFAELEFVQCLGCGVVYKAWEKPGLLAPDFYEQGYFKGRKSGREKRFAHRARKAASWLRDAVECLEVDRRGGARVLDVGCSLGSVIEGARRLGLSGAGVDLSEYAVKVCRERGFEARVGAVDALPYGDGSFEIVVLKHVLEHTIDPRRAVSELRRVLSPGGVALIAVPDVRYWKADTARRTYRYFRPDDLGVQHHVYYSKDTLARLLEGNGFRVAFASKAVYRAHRAARSAVHWLWEGARFAALAGWVAVARRLRMQREVYMVASRVD